MKNTLRILAVVLVVATVVFWLNAGASLGWSKTSVPQKTVEEVTGIEGITYEKRFVPGVDFLGVAALGAGVLTGASFILRSRTNHG